MPPKIKYKKLKGSKIKVPVHKGQRPVKTERGFKWENKPAKLPSRYNWVSLILWVVGTVILAWAAYYWYLYGRSTTYQYEVDTILEGFFVPLAGIGFAAAILAEAAWLTGIGIALLLVGWFLNRRFPGGNFRARVPRVHR